MHGNPEYPHLEILNETISGSGFWAWDFGLNFEVVFPATQDRELHRIAACRDSTTTPNPKPW